jgi:UPF0755 protein
MRPKRRRSCVFPFLLILLGLLFIVALVALIVLFGLPETLTQIGPASPTLESIEKYSLMAYLLFHLGDLDTPVGGAQQVVELDVLQGDSAAAVVSKLEASGLIQDGTLLRNYLRFRGLDTSIEAGGYLLTGDMSVKEIAEALQRAELQERVFTVVEGWRREQIAEALALLGSNIAFQPVDFLQASSQVPVAYSSWVDFPPSASLEGFLFPDTYSLDPDTTASDLIISMLENFDKRISPDLRSGFQIQGLSLYQAVTLASIVEREAVVPDERELIASVFLNRLSLNMSLEADPTVQYALGQQADGSWWKAPLSLTDLEIDSPYNTYRYPGLPIGPISNPGLDSLEAVAFPATTTYLYFRATCDGSGRHSFAETFEEHESNACP